MKKNQRGYRMAQQLSKSNKIPRNKPCPCGSKIKFKHCCWKKIQDHDRTQFSLSREAKKE